LSKPSPARGSAAVDFAVFCGIDVAREIHHAVALDPYGHRLVDRPLPNAEPDLLALFQNLEAHGRVLIVVDQLASIGALAIAVARARGITVAYLPGLAMRRIADLYPGETKTDARDAYVIADAARTLPMPCVGSARTSRPPSNSVSWLAMTPTSRPSPHA